MDFIKSAENKTGSTSGMKMTRSFYRPRTVIVMIVLIVLYFAWMVLSVKPSMINQFSQPENRDELNPSLLTVSEQSRDPAEMPYGRLLEGYTGGNYPDFDGEDLLIPAKEATGKMAIQDGENGVEGKVAVTNGEDGWLEWKVNVDRTALYQVEVTYYSLPGKRSAIERSLLIDGKQPFAEASRVVFPRSWKDGDGFRTDNKGNEVRVEQEEILHWQTVALHHPEELYKRPYKILLTKGEHTIRLTDIKEPMALAGLILKKPFNPPAYQEIAAGYKQLNFIHSQIETIKIQMERPALKSDPLIRSEWSDDALSEPSGTKEIRFNTFGGARWNRGGQAASWVFTVPKDGLYKIGFRFATDSQTASYRSVAIDGVVPFREMEEYAFPAADGWRVDSIKDEGNEPYLFYLTSGEHTLTLTAKVGPYRQTLHDLEAVSQEFGLLTRQVLQVTASSKDASGNIRSDRNRDWYLEQSIPELLSRLQNIRDVLEMSQNRVLEVNGGTRPAYLSALLAGKHLVEKWIADTELIPLQLNELGSTQAAISQAMFNMQQQPLYLDYMLISSPETEYPRGTSTFVENLRVAAGKFIRSFTNENKQVGDMYTDGVTASQNGPVLNVWVARGREWVELLREMIEDDFTSKTGIRVNVNTVPMDAEHLLLLAYTANKAPDVALGLNARIPVEFAVRNALYNLDSMPDIDNVKQRFLPQSLIPYEYQKNLYAIPETQDFQMLFYRTDILNSLGVKPPETWQDVYELMPKLLERDMSFYYPDGVGGYYPFLFQRKGELYTEDRTKSALDSPEAYQSFKEWTDLYNNYKLQLKADFYQRFRTGEMPIGIGNYDFYVRLTTSAPELNGRWAMSPIPGQREQDGRINRSAGGAGQAGVIMKSTRNPDAAWAFLSWWTSEEAQLRFGSEIEGLLGVGSRWNTANLEAMKGMAWSRSEIEQIMKQWSWFKEMPVVLGGYYTDRHLLNAWNKTVLLGINPRIALEDAVKEINKELLRKQEEFGNQQGGGE